MTTPASNTPSVLYRTVVADPPWPLKGGGRQLWREGRPSGLTRPMPYPTMSLSEIAALAVEPHVDHEAHLYLWTTQKFLRNAYDVVEAWGFRPSATVLTWCKKPYGRCMGRLFGSATEFILFGWRGTPPPKGRPTINRNWFTWTRGQHSQKPEAFYDLVEQVSPAPRLELFARRQRLGWDTWGDEAFEHIAIPVGHSARCCDFWPECSHVLEALT